MKQVLRVALFVAAALLIGFVGHVAQVKRTADRMRQTSDHVQAGMLAWVEKHKDPKEARAIMGDVVKALQAEDLSKAEELLNRAVVVLGPDAKHDAGEGLPTDDEREAQGTDLYEEPQHVEISGYTGEALDPFLSADGKYLFFNNSNDSADSSIYLAERTGPLAFKFVGELQGVNSKVLDAIPSMDEAGHFYFVSMRDYDKTEKTVFTGDFNGKGVTNVHAVDGDITMPVPGVVNLDASISPDGKTLYISRALFSIDRKEPRLSDIVIAHREGNKFQLDPKSADILENVNTQALEYAAAISADGKELYFTRTSRKKGFRLMVARRASTSDPFGEPQFVDDVSGLAEAPAVSKDGKELFYHKTVHDKFEIFRLTRGGKGK